MGDTLEKLVDYAPVGLLVNAFGGDAGGSVSKALGMGDDYPTPVNTTEVTVTGENSVEAQAAQRRLARLSRYFTTPTGVLDSSTGSQGVF